MIFVDSTVLIDYFNGKRNWQVDKLDAILGNKIIVIGDIVLTEVLQGFRKDADFKKAVNVLQNFPCYPVLGEKLAIQSAKNFRFLKKKGITCRKTIDAIIATFCIENRITLLHNDKDFLPFEKFLNLKVCSK